MKKYRIILDEEHPKEARIDVLDDNGVSTKLVSADELFDAIKASADTKPVSTPTFPILSHTSVLQYCTIGDVGMIALYRGATKQVCSVDKKDVELLIPPTVWFISYCTRTFTRYNASVWTVKPDSLVFLALGDFSKIKLYRPKGLLNVYNHDASSCANICWGDVTGVNKPNLHYVLSTPNVFVSFGFTTHLAKLDLARRYETDPNNGDLYGYDAFYTEAWDRFVMNSKRR